MREWTRGPLHRPRSAHCPETDALAPRQTTPRSQRKEDRPQKRTVVHLRVRSESKGYSPALQSLLVTQGLAGNNGFSWDIMGFCGQSRISATFSWDNLVL